MLPLEARELAEFKSVFDNWKGCETWKSIFFLFHSAVPAIKGSNSDTDAGLEQ